MGILHKVIHKAGRWYIRETCRREFEGQAFHRINERPIEYRFVLESLTRLAPTTILDVGTGTTALPHLLRNCGFLVTAIDNIRDYWKDGNFINRHYHVIDDNILNCKTKDRFDIVTCISVLEHIPDHQAAVRSMFALLNPGGHVILTFPYNENTYIPNAYSLPESSYGQDAPYVCQVYSRAEVDGWLAENGARIITQEYWRMFTCEFWTEGQTLRPPQPASRDQPHQLTCLLLQKPA